MDLGERGTHVPFVSHFMTQYKKDMDQLRDIQKKIVDYIFIEDDPSLEDELVPIYYTIIIMFLLKGSFHCILIQFPNV